MEESVAKLILDASGDPDSSKTCIAQGLFNAALKNLEDKDEEEFTEIDLKLVEYGKVEREGDLAYFDYNSWLKIPFELKARICANIDPLFWGGTYFRYSFFLEIEEELVRNIPEDLSIIVINEQERFKFLNIQTIHGDRHDYLTDRQLNFQISKINNFVIRAYGQNKKGETVIHDKKTNKKKVLGGYF